MKFYFCTDANFRQTRKIHHLSVEIYFSTFNSYEISCDKLDISCNYIEIIQSIAKLDVCGNYKIDLKGKMFFRCWLCQSKNSYDWNKKKVHRRNRNELKSNKKKTFHSRKKWLRKFSHKLYHKITFQILGSFHLKWPKLSVRWKVKLGQTNKYSCEKSVFKHY